MCEHGETPPRPAVPMLLYALVAVLVAERALLRCGRPWLQDAAGVAALAAALVLLLASGVARLMRPHVPLAGVVVAVGMLAAWALASCALDAGAALVAALGDMPVSAWSLRVASDPSQGASGYRCRATASAAGKPAGDVWLQTTEPYALGTTVCGTGSFSALGEDEWGTSSRMQGVWGTVRLARVTDVEPARGLQGLVCALRERVLMGVDATARPSRALLAGCACGERSALRAQGLDDLFARCGAAHLVAVSGGHLSVLTSLLSVALGALRLRPRTRLGVLAGASGLFVLMCGAPVSAVRSWMMALAALVGGLAGRRAHALSGVCVVGLALALTEPAVSGQLGFVLSVTSVCGLCLFSRYASCALAALVGGVPWPPRLPARLRRPLARAGRSATDALAASLVAQLSTLPLTAEAFGQVSLVGPLANLAATVPFTLFVGTGLVACALWWVPPLQAVALACADVLGDAVLAVLGHMATLPYASVAVSGGAALTAGVVALGVTLLVAWPRVSRRRMRAGALVALLVLGLLVVRWRLLAPACVRVLDVGQGDAILVQDGSAAVLVDAGPDDAVAAALARGHVLHLDAVLITHLHADHYAGLADLVGGVPCDRVLVAAGVSGHMDAALAETVRELTGGDAQELAYGDVLRAGGFALEVVWPRVPVEGDENADSLELVVRYDEGGRTLVGLLTGDAERDETGAVLERGDVGDVDFLKVGHHGSEVSLTAAQATALDPEVAVASAGENNSYGHPRPECVEALEGAGALFLCTKDVGDVEIRPGTDGPTVRCQRAPAKGDSPVWLALLAKQGQSPLAGARTLSAGGSHWGLSPLAD